MNTSLITVGAIVSLGILYVLLPVAIYTFQRYRDKKIVQCPETQGMVEVNVDAGQAAVSSAFGRPVLRINNCILWPKRKGCNQGCATSL